MTEVFEKMEALKAQAVVCTDCGLAETRSNVVFGNGDPTSKLVIVAEGPSATDEHTLIPFSGPSGVLLDEVLHANDLDRDEIWITNRNQMPGRCPRRTCDKKPPAESWRD